MNADKLSYGDLSFQELSDEISGLDKEIEDCQVSLAKLKRNLKQKQQLRDTLIEIASNKTKIKRWHTRPLTA